MPEIKDLPLGVLILVLGLILLLSGLNLIGKKAKDYITPPSGATKLFIVILGISLMLFSGYILWKSVTETNIQSNPTLVENAASTAPSIITPEVNPGLPTYKCASYPFVSFLTLQQMTMTGIDAKNGFHLEIVPIALDENSNYSEKEVTVPIKNGEWDCIITTMETVLIFGDYGYITAINDESTGGEQIWAQEGIESVEQLVNQKIAFPEDTTLTMDFLLGIAGLTKDTNSIIQSGSTESCRPVGRVLPVQTQNLEDAMNLYNMGEVQAVFGWIPDIENLNLRGAHLVASDDSLRISISVIITSKQAVNNKPEMVQAFHNAWFETLRAQFEYPQQAANAIAAWGHNDWTGISSQTPFDDFSYYMQYAAQATIDSNYYMMSSPNIIPDMLKYQKQLLDSSGYVTLDIDTSGIVLPTFVIEAFNNPALHTTAIPINPSFHFGIPANSNPTLNQLDRIAEIPFEFGADSTSLSKDAQERLSFCVVPILKLFGTQDIVLQIIGSSAWPPGYSAEEISDFALKRAQAVESILVNQGVQPEQLKIEARIPDAPCENAEGCPQDRYVKLFLLTSGGK